MPFPPRCGCGMLKQNMASFSLDSCSPPASAVVEAGNANPAPQGRPGPPQHSSCSTSSLGKGLLRVQCCIYPLLSPPTAHLLCVPARSSTGEEGCEGSGIKRCRETCPGEGLPCCSAASMAVGGTLGAVVPARAAVIQRLSEAHGTGVALHRPARFHGLLLLPCLTFCSLDSSVISLGSIFSCWVDSPGCVPYLCRIGHLHQSFPNPLWTPPKPAAEGSDSLKHLPNTSTSTCSIGAVHWCCFGMWDPGGINGLWRWLRAPGWHWDGSGSIFHPGFVVRPRQKGSVLHSLPVPLLCCQTLSGAPGCAGSPRLVQMWQRWGFS